MSDTFVDQLGQEIRPGDVVAYGTRAGNSGAIRIAKVTDVQQVTATRVVDWKSRESETYTAWHVTVQSVVKDYYPTTRVRWGRKTKPNTDNMVKLALFTPEHVERLLGITAA